MKQSGDSLEVQNKCAEIKIRAERRAGTLLKDMQDKGEVLKPSDTLNKGTKSPLLHDEITEKKHLSEVGITSVQSHRWKTLSDMPEEEFEKHI